MIARLAVAVVVIGLLGCGPDRRDRPAPGPGSVDQVVDVDEGLEGEGEGELEPAADACGWCEDSTWSPCPMVVVEDDLEVCWSDYFRTKARPCAVPGSC